MQTDDGGWTVIQRRGKFPVQLDFQKDWESYKKGFGNVSEEFWLAYDLFLILSGNENIRVLCEEGCEIRFDLEDEKGEKGFALYRSFNLSGSNYRISITGYTGNIGDSMQHGNNNDFSTKDRGNTEKVKRYKGGWWYGSAGYFCNLNGIYQPGRSNDETVGCFLTTIYSEEPVNSGCLEREKALALLETAENLLTKARTSFPSCKENINSTNELECAGKKSLAYIEISKKLISYVRKSFPTCSKPIEKDDKIIQEVKHRDCSEILTSGHNESGVYTIWTEESFTTGKSLKVYCDMETDKGGWTVILVIQRRGKFPVQQDFYLDWESYKNGFGNITQEFWLGNENIHVLCLKGCKIRFDLQDRKGAKGFALYQNFKLSDSSYRLNISGYTGNVGDGMKYDNNNDFATKDKGTEANKAMKFKGGWWYGNNGYFCNLNGIYQPGRTSNDIVLWHTWRELENLAKVEMKVKQKKSFYFSVLFIGFLTVIHAAGSKESGCLQKEKTLTLLETAEDLLTKATNSFPTCKEDVNSTDQSECGRKKSLAYIEVSKKMISDVRRNFPSCPKVIEKYDKPRDCSEIFTSGQKQNGVFTIWPRQPFTTGKPLDVYCDMQTDNGGWTDWESYKNGFGNLLEEYWLGNENIRALCPNGCEIRFDLVDEKGERGFAHYQNFYLSSGNYRLNITGYTGNVGDSMRVHHNIDFSTKDKGDSEKSKRYKGGWWYGHGGYYCNLNGIYQPGESNDATVHWYAWRQAYNLANVEMKVRPK
ncbi:unnamed protein product [Larinioides sclopetarius]|uniref:Fibrinogen C-terminal domain-containing protein n=1 Tax=Larinioides sclopetarius TaxID=280406 RepID=A0AAV1ZGA5_9ARAC